ncbi:myosin light chain kinase, partial [Nannochloropsis oceanica]
MPRAAFLPTRHAIIFLSFLPLFLLLIPLVPVPCVSSFSFINPISIGSSSRSVSGTSRRSSVSRTSSEKSISSSSTGMSSSFLPCRPSFIEPEELLALLQAQRQGVKSPTIKIVDVRDDDFEVAKLPGAINVPSEEWHEDERVDTLVQELKDYDLVIFHCMLSQVRGPKCSNRFRARLSVLKVDEEEEEEEEGRREGGKEGGRPRVFVLRGGFQGWYARFSKGQPKPARAQVEQQQQQRLSIGRVAPPPQQQQTRRREQQLKAMGNKSSSSASSSRGGQRNSVDKAGLPTSVRAKASSDALNQHLASEEEEERKDEVPHKARGGKRMDGEDTMNGADFDSVYMLSKKLGEGAFGLVFLCIHRETKKKCAVKVVDTSRLNLDDARHMEDEIDILKSLNHVHIVELFHVFRTDRTVYIVQELCAGGELFDRIVEKTHYNEGDARELIKRVLQAVSYAHAQGIVHRDLKPENILLREPEDDVHVKLA